MFHRSVEQDKHQIPYGALSTELLRQSFEK